MSRHFIFFLLSCVTGFAACNSGDEKTQDVASIMADSSRFTTIKWLDTLVDFGTAKMGEVVNLSFRCENIGSKPLYLFDVRPGCGCTLVDYTKEAIAPGKQGKIDAQFDTNKSHPGAVHKTVFVRSNNNNDSRTSLVFSGTVLAADSTKTKN